MTKRVKTILLFFCLLSSMVVFAACSYSTEFVVINAWNGPIEIRYTLKKPKDPIAPSRLPEVPSVKLSSELEQQIAWRELPPSRFAFNANTRTAVVSLMPGEALRVEQRKMGEGPQDDAYQGANFSIEEIIITGSNGEMKFEGEEARKSFVSASKTLYALTYR